MPNDRGRRNKPGDDVCEWVDADDPRYALSVTAAAPAHAVEERGAQEVGAVCHRIGGGAVQEGVVLGAHRRVLLLGAFP